MGASAERVALWAMRVWMSIDSCASRMMVRRRETCSVLRFAACTLRVSSIEFVSPKSVVVVGALLDAHMTRL